MPCFLLSKRKRLKVPVAVIRAAAADPSDTRTARREREREREKESSSGYVRDGVTRRASKKNICRGRWEIDPSRTQSVVNVYIRNFGTVVVFGVYTHLQAIRPVVSRIGSRGVDGREQMSFKDRRFDSPPSERGRMDDSRGKIVESVEGRRDPPRCSALSDTVSGD